MGEFKKKENGRGFRFYKGIMRLVSKKVKFYYLGEEIKSGDFILSNHEAKKGPWAWELYCNHPVRLLGIESANSGFKSLYKYQSEIYYHQKNHWPLWLARLFCLVAAPTTYLYYKGADVISIRGGTAYRETIKESYKALSEFQENLVMFPEDSSEGYFEEIKEFKGGFLLICDYCLKHGLDLRIFVSYYRKKDSVCIVDKPIYYSEILKKYETKEAILENLKNRCNELGKYEIHKK